MINKKQNVLIAYALVMGPAFFTAFSYILGKKVSEDLYPETVAFYWFFGAFLFAVIKRLIFMVFGTKFRVPIKELSKYNEVMIISSIITVFGVAFWVIALRSVGPPVTSFLMKFQVVFSVILGAALLNERLRKLEIFGIILTIMGGVVIAYDTSGFELKGSIFAIMAAFCYSCLFIIVRKRSSNLNMMMVATLRSLGVSIIGVLYLLFSDRFQLPSNIDLIYMLIGGTCGAYIGKALQFQAIKLVDVSRTTAVTPLEAVFVVLLTFFFFDTIPSSSKLIGGGFIVVGVIFLLIFRKENLD